MDTLSKMRLRKDRRKALIIERGRRLHQKLMGGYILYLYKTVGNSGVEGWW